VLGLPEIPTSKSTRGLMTVRTGFRVDRSLTARVFLIRVRRVDAIDTVCLHYGKPRKASRVRDAVTTRRERQRVIGYYFLGELASERGRDV